MSLIVIKGPSSCPSLLGQKLGHHLVPLIDTDTEKEVGIVCSRCGMTIGPRRARSAHKETTR